MYKFIIRFGSGLGGKRKFSSCSIYPVALYLIYKLFLKLQYPVCWQVECHKGKPQEKEGFAQFVKELSEEFKPRGWLLSAAVSPSKMVIDAGYAIPKLAKHFDWISVMTYGKYP